MFRPFIRWAGGKRWLCSRIQRYLPLSFTDYYEPFLGGGSVFFCLQEKGLLKNEIFLSDCNTQLINAYKLVRDNPESLIAWLQKRTYTEEEYYKIRNHYNLYPFAPSASVEFIYLNKCGFNGIYRVNQKGEYNVPFGNKCEINSNYYELLNNDSKALQKASITKQDYKTFLKKKIRPQSLVFIDPPYTTSYTENGFIAYNKKTFSLEDQRNLLKVVQRINDSNAFFLMTNAYHDVVKDIFGHFQIREEIRQSLIGGKKAVRQQVKEYIITNYNVGE